MAKACKTRGAHPEMVIFGLHLDHKSTLGENAHSPTFPLFSVFLLKLLTVCFFNMTSFISLQSSLALVLSTYELAFGHFRGEKDILCSIHIWLTMLSRDEGTEGL